MSTKAWKWAKTQTLPNHTQKYLLEVIADYYNDEWFRAWPSTETLAERMCASTRTVRRALDELEFRAGLIRREWWKLPNKSQTSNRILLPTYSNKSQQRAIIHTYWPDAAGGTSYRQLVRVPGSGFCVLASDLPEVASGLAGKGADILSTAFDRVDRSSSPF